MRHYIIDGKYRGAPPGVAEGSIEVAQKEQKNSRRSKLVQFRTSTKPESRAQQSKWESLRGGRSHDFESIRADASHSRLLWSAHHVGESFGHFPYPHVRARCCLCFSALLLTFCFQGVAGFKAEVCCCFEGSRPFEEEGGRPHHALQTNSKEN